MARNDARIIYLRKTVQQALNKIWEYPLTVVEAPMGYGKTTALKEYLKSTHSEVLWQTLLDDSPTIFWNGISRLFRKLNAEAAEKLAVMGIPGNSVFLDEAIRIIEEIDFPEKTAIVLDDYHLISSEAIDHFFEVLAKTEIPNLHVVVVSRSIFGENTDELVLKGYCYVINKNCFALSREDIIEYSRLRGVKLDKEKLDFLVSYTEGWISALYLCLQGYLQYGRFEDQASLYELMEKVVYRRISAQARDFLLTICIFDNFTIEQAEYMWNLENVEALLRELAENNAFIQFDQATRQYYIHNIFTSYLRRIFDRQSYSRKQAVWTTAGKWYVSVGAYIPALDYFFKANAFAELLTAVELDKGNNIWNEHKEKLIRYFSECPGDIKCIYPKACLIYAINLFSFNEMELFAKECEEIGMIVSALPDEREQEKNQLLGELELLCSFAKYNHIGGMSEHIQRAGSLLKGSSEFMDRNSSWTFGSPSVLYMFYRESGQLERAVNEMNVAITEYCRLTAGHGSGADSVMQAERYYNMGDFENAEILAHRALHSARNKGQTAIVLCALFLQLRIAVATGDSGYVMSSLKETQEELKQQEMYQYLHTWDMCEGFIYSCFNMEKKVPVWIAQGDLQNRTIYFPSYAFFNIVWGKSLLISGQYLKLIGLAETFIEIASVFPNLLGQVYTYIYDAAAKYKLGRNVEAHQALIKALDIAIPDKIIMPFVETREYIAPVLTELEIRSHYFEFIRSIHEIFPLYLKNRENISMKISSDNNELPLTEREVAIAELIATGLTSRDIGKSLHIAEITVKKALQKIYEKLGINSRTALAKIIIENKNR